MSYMGKLGAPSESQLKRDKIVFVALLIAVFTYGLIYCIVPLQTVFYVACPFCIYYLWRTKVNPFDLEFLFLFMSMMLVAIQAFVREPWLSIQWSNVKLAWVFPTVYVLGKVAVGVKPEESDRRAMLTMGALASGMYVQALLNYANRIKHPLDPYAWFGFFSNDWEVKNVFDFGYLLMLPAFYWGFKKRKESKVLFATTTIMALSGVVLSLFAKGRTVAVMFVLVTGMLFLADLLTNWNDINKSIKKAIGVFFALIFVLLGVIIFLVKINAFGLGELYSDSFLSRDGGIFNNVRFNIFKDAIIQTLRTSEGGWTGAYINGGTHDTWLEFSRVYGTPVFVFLICFVCLSLIKSILVLFDKQGEDVDKYFLTGGVIALFIYLTLEPVGYYPRYYIVFFIFVSGIITRKFEFEGKKHEY